MEKFIEKKVKNYNGKKFDFRHRTANGVDGVSVFASKGNFIKFVPTKTAEEIKAVLSEDK